MCNERLFTIVNIVAIMKFSKEYILRRSFDVFMNIGYDSASISVLQKELGMSRGAMYRYFENKEDLFCAVIDEYFFKVFDKLLQNIEKADLTTIELIERLNRRQKVILKAFTKAGVTHTFFLNYTALLIQAAKYYPDFVNDFRVIRLKMKTYWEKALINSIKKGEVRSDVNIEIMSTLFSNLSVKESTERDLNDSSFAIEIEQDMRKREEVLYYLYGLIKT